MLRLAFAFTSLLISTAALSASPARLEKGIAPAGPAKVAVERWFTGNRNIICTDNSGKDGQCDLGRALAFRTFYAPNDTDAFVFAYYSSDIGNAVSIAVAQFHRVGSEWSLTRPVKGVYGEGPDQLSFENGKAVFAMDALMPGDARCCLTGKQRYVVDLTTGAVTAGPKMAGSKARIENKPIAVQRTSAPRPEGYEGATYDHNGSQVLVDERSGTIRYDVPKASIRSAVRKGTVLFKGSFASNGSVSGTAYVFKAGCEPAPYTVAGWSKGSTITLKGTAPRRDPNSCSVLGTTSNGANTTLKFEEFGDL